jgi:hypothetical protein
MFKDQEREEIQYEGAYNGEPGLTPGASKHYDGVKNLY